MAIYTRTGDKGKTSLLSGQRVSKYHIRVEVLGTIDELNSAVGVAIAGIKNRELRIKNELIRIQSDLMGIASMLASAKVRNQKLEIKSLTKRVGEFEDLIDEITEQMPHLSNFIIPGGGKIGSLLHFARTVCRRAERKIVLLSQKEKLDNRVIMYVNRLSDLLFTMARFANFKDKIKDRIWVKQ